MSNIQIPGPQFGLNEIIDAYTVKYEEERKKKEKYHPLRPSSAGKCERELGHEYMEYQGHATYEREPMSASTVRLLNLGHHIERAAIGNMYDAFGEMDAPIKIRYKQQTLSLGKLPDGRFLEGSMDLGVEGDQWKILIDWKSKGDKYSSYFKSSWDEFVEKLVSTGFAASFGVDAVYITDLEKFLEAFDDVFFAANLLQLNLYANADFMKERGFGICSIMQYNKNDSRIREVRFVPSEAVAIKVKEKFDRVQKTVDDTKSVEGLNKDHMLGSAKCAFCSFKKQCWPEDDALKAFFQNLPPKQWPKDLDRLPKDTQDELEVLFNEFEQLSHAPSKLEKIEQKIISVLSKLNLYKVRLKNQHIYRVKKLKTGGVANGERMVLRRDKL